MPDPILLDNPPVMANARRTMTTAQEIIRRVETALQRDDEAAAVAALEQLVGCSAISAEESRKLAVLARTMDRNDLALAALAAGPDCTQVQMMALQLRTESGEEVADEVAALLGPEPPAGPQLLQLVGAFDIEGRSGEAIRLLEKALQEQPDWVPGHQALVQLRWQAHETSPSRSFEEALSHAPGQELLWAAWLGTVMRMQDRGLFDRVAKEARKLFPTSQLVAMICADGSSEMGRTADADALFQQLAGVADRNFDAARMRHTMRYCRFPETAKIGERAITSHGDMECWAWLGAAWRLSGDPRSDWFHRGTALIGTHDLDYSPADLQSLAGVLRALHRSSGPPLGQSPRGGTQTPGPLLKRFEPEIRQLRQKLKQAVRQYIETLPAPDPRHPFLGRPRRAFWFEGAWSIRLRPGGLHLSHIHSHGWISSALYVDVPNDLADSPGQEGWLQFGVPLLPEGEVAGEPLRVIPPVNGRLALFPSIFWHGTKPFHEGEQRLTVAFDVVPR